MLLEEDKPWSQVERILDSNTFHASSALRRLLRFLADKAFSGEADQLKEYSIGIDAFGKPPSYDPRQDAIVRLQIGRLRQKLGEYYRTEGKDDPVIIELPKGRFKLSWETRLLPIAASEPAAAEAETNKSQPGRPFPNMLVALGAALLISLLWNAYSVETVWRDQNQPRSTPWTPELEQLWRPFLVAKQPVVLAVADPLFVGLQGTDAFFRRKSLNRWEDARGSKEVALLRGALGNPPIQATFNFTPRGELISSFLLGKLLGTSRQDISLARTSQVPLQGFAENNVVLIGPEVVLDEKLAGIQIAPEFTLVSSGIRNLHPRPGEPVFLADKPAGTAPDDGEVYALVSHAPGPLGNTDVVSFTSNRTWGRQGAVQAFTDPALARMLVNKLKGRSGKVPRFYQMVLKVKFVDGLPIDISYELHHALAPL